MSKKKISLFLVFICIIILIFSNRSITNLKAPDKIVIHNKSTNETIEKNDKLYNDIYKLVEEGVEDDLHEYKTGLGEQDMDRMKNNDIVLEFIYNSQQKRSLSSNAGARKYYALIIPLTGDYKGMIFFEENVKNYVSPLGYLKSIESILKLLNTNSDNNAFSNYPKIAFLEHVN